VKIDRSASQQNRDTQRADAAARPTGDAGSTGGAGSAGGGAPRDAIELSSDARRVIQMPMDRAQRAQLVEQLRQQVDAGTYRPDAEAVARRIAEEFGH
jgi:flagellar biosynthesis anti-sigma factor FlgM